MGLLEYLVVYTTSQTERSEKKPVGEEASSETWEDSESERVDEG